MKRFQRTRGIRGCLSRLIDPLLSSVFARFDGIASRLGRVEDRLDGLEGRLDRIESRLDVLEPLLDEVSARSSARTEAANAAMESGARTARRLEEIERILGAR